jgi:RimK-like ATP-grasp domain
MKRVFVIGSIKDRTTRYFAEFLIDRGIAFNYIDVARHVMDGSIELKGGELSFALPHEVISASYSDGFFYRYIGLPDSVKHEVKVKFWKDIGVLHDFFDLKNVRVSFKNRRNSENFSKLLHQVKVASVSVTSFVKFPETIVSNSKKDILNFAERHNFDLISKGVSGTKTWAKRMDRASLMSRLALVGDLPILLQQRIGPAEVRAHVVDCKVIAERIESTADDYRRRGSKVSHERTTLPTHVEEWLVSLCAKLGCPFMGIDLRVDLEGNYYFLEANSMPCFEGYDRRSSGAISSALIEYLLRKY